VTELLVVDASVAGAWLLRSQATEAASRLLRKLPEHRTLAPYVFVSEVTSFLLEEERRPGGSQRGTEDKLAFLDRLQIAIADPLEHEEIQRILSIARVSGASLIDSIYLDLAAGMDATVATRDAGMASGAARLGLRVIDVGAAQH